MPKVTYYALVNDEHPVERPAGIVRRIHADPLPMDEEFTRGMKWVPSEYFRLHRLGHNEQDHVEIDQKHAEAVIAAWKESADWAE